MAVKRYRMFSASLRVMTEVCLTGFGEVSVETADGVQYLPSELKKLEAIGAEVDPAVHALKKLFRGTIEKARNLTAQEIYVREKYGQPGE